MKRQLCPWNFKLFWLQESQLLGGGNFKTGWPISIVGHIHACPTRFLAQRARDVYDIENIENTVGGKKKVFLVR